MIVFAGILPHPPLLIPGVGKGQEKDIAKTFSAYNDFAERLAAAEPDTIIIVSPHMIHYPHLFNVCGMSDLYGSFKNFGDINFEWHGHNDLELAEEISDKSEEEGLPTILYNNGEGEYEVDHGVMVPVYFISQKLDFSHKILPMGYSIASRGEHYTMGQVISEVCERRRDKRVAVIASGDLSHRLHENKPESGKSQGEKFDKYILDALKKGDEYSIVNIDEATLDEAGECGYKSILILLGAISGKDFKPEVISYEGPFGVGYAVVDMHIKE